MQVTISLLPVSLSLVHVPRSRLPSLTNPVLRQILQPNPTFLNISCNEIELSIFAENRVLRDFEPIVRRDRQRQSHSRSSSKRGFSARADPGVDPVEISYDKWSVLQIDSHSDQLDNSGARVNELSAPLAAAGISILYQSSYMSDFIFVKESCLQEAVKLFASAGFHLYSSDSHLSTMSPISPTNDSASILNRGSNQPGAVLTRTRASTNSCLTSQECSHALKATPNAEQSSLRTKSHSPSSGDVDVLLPDLVCVGLSDELGVDHWGLKVVKLVAFPDLIQRSSNSAMHVSENSATFESILTRSGMETNWDDSSSCSSDEDDGYFSHSPPTSPYTSVVTSASWSDTDLMRSLSSHKKSSSKHIVSPLSPLRQPQHSLSIAADATASDHTKPTAQHRVPFFSFTRTAEGSSLTADVNLLAILFPPHERHMVICSGELDAADRRLAGSESQEDDSEIDDFSSQSETLKCLQIDLRRFGLDKHGLVNRFSRVLEENNINHMYSSTFKTANLLVDKKHAIRAQSLLRAC